MLIEQNSQACGLPILSSEAIDHIASDERGRNPLLTDEFDGVVKEASYLVIAGDVNHDETLEKMPKEGKNVQFAVGDVTLRNDRQLVSLLKLELMPHPSSTNCS